MDERSVSLDFEGHLAIVTLRRPHVRNAIDASVVSALAGIVEQTNASRDVRVVLLTGEGDTFCSGADLAVVAAGGMKTLFHPDYGFAGFVSATRTKPWIAAVDGHAVAGGCEIALSCDMIVATDRARFGLPEVKRGLIAAAGGVYRISRLIPPMVARELILTGDPLPAAEAKQWGLVNHVVAPELLMEEARRLANAIAANAPLAVQASLAVARDCFDRPDEALMRECRDELWRLMATDDYAEGPRAFLEKRPPIWSGR